MPEAPAQGVQARDFGLAALQELTPASTIGEPVGEIDEGDGVITYLFDAVLAGYPGWRWGVSVVQLEGAEPTLLETQLLPGDDSLLAPEWIPWSERMEDYRAAQLALGEAESDDDEDDDDADEDEFGSSVLHGGDLDGVDIDEVDLPEVPAPEAGGESEAGSEPEPEPAQPAKRARRPRRATSAMTVVGVEQADQAEAESGSASEKPPRVTRSRQRADKEQQDD